MRNEASVDECDGYTLGVSRLIRRSMQPRDFIRRASSLLPSRAEAVAMRAIASALLRGRRTIHRCRAPSRRGPDMVELRCRISAPPAAASNARRLPSVGLPVPGQRPRSLPNIPERFRASRGSSARSPAAGTSTATSSSIAPSPPGAKWLQAPFPPLLEADSLTARYLGLRGPTLAPASGLSRECRRRGRAPAWTQSVRSRSPSVAQQQVFR